ncbi:ABC transporter substrate-binding protein [Cohnella rhizosphaerae]|uniref:Extracellular solute-binding protein n=1 Tax=Cohnella rhizosphaerae TaxID=1457232 RepID=A0A9X4KSR3_9BACL|nr:extracellular solute-binding protein [Cohnella rhizosphaerae]MDG0809581.1 extracellular solute-binding protein [Cohnella rhizosphaerae]
MHAKQIKSGLTAAVSVLMAAALAACGGGESGSGGSPSSSASPSPSASASASAKPSETAPAAKPVTLSVIMHADWAKGGPWEQIMKGYEEKSGNKVDLQIVSDNFEQMVLTKIATEDIPDVLFFFSQSSAIKKAQSGKKPRRFVGRILHFADQSDHFEILPAGRRQGVRHSDERDERVGRPLQQKKYLPTSACPCPARTTSCSQTPRRSRPRASPPFYEAGKDGWPLQVFTFSGFANLLAKQPDLMDKINAHQTTFDQIPEFVDMLQKQADLVKKGYANKNLFSGTYDLSLDELATGKSAMVINADWALPTLLAKYPDAPVGMFPQPFEADSYVGISDPQAAFAFKNSKNVEQAKDLLAYIAEPETLKTYYDAAKTMPSWLGVEAALNGGTADLQPVVEAGRAAPFFNGLTAVSVGDYTKELQALYGGDKTAAEVAKALQKNIDTAAKAAGLAGW